MADTRGVNIADPREARLHSAVLLQGLAGGGEEQGMFIVEKRKTISSLSQMWHFTKSPSNKSEHRSQTISYSSQMLEQE